MGLTFHSHEEITSESPNISVGLQPVDHPEVYEKLLSCHCVRLVQRAYYFNDHSLCQDCYYHLDPDDQDLYADSASHYICGQPGCIRAAHCKLCGIRIAQLYPTIICHECIEKYFELTPIDKHLLTQGMIIIPVISR
jgi:hypothetical protein